MRNDAASPLTIPNVLRPLRLDGPASLCPGQGLVTTPAYADVDRRTIFEWIDGGDEDAQRGLDAYASAFAGRYRSACNACSTPTCLPSRAARGCHAALISHRAPLSRTAQSVHGPARRHAPPPHYPAPPWATMPTCTAPSRKPARSWPSTQAGRLHAPGRARRRIARSPLAHPCLRADRKPLPGAQASHQVASGLPRKWPIRVLLSQETRMGCLQALGQTDRQAARMGP